MKYRIDLHLHTDASPDSRMCLQDAVKRAKKRGISAFAVSDHNRCPAQEVFDRPLRQGVLLIPSVEYSTECGHLLGLFLERACHVSGQEEGRIRFSDAAAAIHAAGGLCILAHPFELTNRSPEEISSCIVAHAAELDGLEILNPRATKKRQNANRLAAEALRLLPEGALRTAGSDAHTPGELGGASVTVEAEALTLPALRAALQEPLDTSCGKCPHLAFARSQFIRLRKQKSGFSAYCRWILFAGICLLRAGKGVFQ